MKYALFRNLMIAMAVIASSIIYIFKICRFDEEFEEVQCIVFDVDTASAGEAEYLRVFLTCTNSQGIQNKTTYGFKLGDEVNIGDTFMGNRLIGAEKVLAKNKYEATFDDSYRYFIFIAIVTGIIIFGITRVLLDIKIRIVDPFEVGVLNDKYSFRCKIIDQVSDSYMFDFGREIQYSEKVSFQFLIGKIENSSKVIDLLKDRVKEERISLAVYSKEAMSKRLRFEDMRGYFLSGEITT